MSFSLDQSAYERIVELALEEDIGIGDVTCKASIDTQSTSKASLVAKQELVLCGMDVVEYVFKKLDPDCEFTRKFNDGDSLVVGDTIATMFGSSISLLEAERTALNFLQRMSGVATLTRQYADLVKETATKVLDTRKTIPGFRALDKYAVRVGGGHNHRSGLFDGVLIKENHIRAAGGIKEAITACKENAHHLLEIEVEVTNDDELDQALEAGARVIMIDNFSILEAAAAVRKIDGKARLEVSGNVDLESVGCYASAGVDFVSIGRLTHSATAVDISMLFDKDGK